MYKYRSHVHYTRYDVNFASRHGKFARKSPIAKTRFRLFLGNQSSYLFSSFFIRSRRLYQTSFENIKPFEKFVHFQNMRKPGAKSIPNKL